MRQSFVLEALVFTVSNSCLLSLPGYMFRTVSNFVKALWSVYNYFIPFCATVKTITQGRPKAKGNSASGHPQHRGCDSLDCCTEKYEIVVSLPNSELTKGNNEKKSISNAY